jgi:hypothetical protein
MSAVSNMSPKQLIGPLKELLAKSPQPKRDAPEPLGEYLERQGDDGRRETWEQISRGELLIVHRRYVERTVELLEARPTGAAR